VSSLSFFYFWARSQNYVKRLLASSLLYVCLSVRSSVCPSAWENSNLIGRIFIEFDTGVFFANLSRKFDRKFNYNLTRITVVLHEDLCTVMVIPC
jgi:hypothetical protein